MELPVRALGPHWRLYEFYGVKHRLDLRAKNGRWHRNLLRQFERIVMLREKVTCRASAQALALDLGRGLAG